MLLLIQTLHYHECHRGQLVLSSFHQAKTQKHALDTWAVYNLALTLDFVSSARFRVWPEKLRKRGPQLIQVPYLVLARGCLGRLDVVLHQVRHGPAEFLRLFAVLVRVVCVLSQYRAQDSWVLESPTHQQKSSPRPSRPPPPASPCGTCPGAACTSAARPRSRSR